VQVGKAETLAPAPTSNELYLQPVKDAKGKGVVKAFYKGQPAAEIEIAVSGPTGWTKTSKTDKNGVLEFELLWKGVYGMEGFYTSDETGAQGGDGLCAHLAQRHAAAGFFGRPEIVRDQKEPLF
jgi:hypothetical protein